MFEDFGLITLKVIARVRKQYCSLAPKKYNLTDLNFDII